MKDFAAIDFETANHHRTSVCSVSVVIVRNGNVVDKFYRLIKSYPNYYSDWATKCHGLSAQDTADALLFPEVWAEIAHQIKGFDEPHLRECHHHYDIQYPNHIFRCTLWAARRNFHELPNHQLRTVSSHVGTTTTHWPMLKRVSQSH